MTVEQLEARKKDLLAQQAQLIANTHAINGAIQQCDWSIAELKKEAVPAQPEQQS